jgi:hypothetical protein
LVGSPCCLQCDGAAPGWLDLGFCAAGNNTPPDTSDAAADTLTQYKLTGQLPNGGAAGFAGVVSPKKRGKKPKLNKDGSEKQPRKPTAYNAWMQSKVRRGIPSSTELKLPRGHVTKSLDQASITIPDAMP